jgi:hypothetical protein
MQPLTKFRRSPAIAETIVETVFVVRQDVRPCELLIGISTAPRLRHQKEASGMHRCVVRA